MKTSIAIWAGFLTAFWFVGCGHTPTKTLSGEQERSRNPAASAGNAWTLSGFLPGAASKSYLSIVGGKITAISSQAPTPGGLLVDTNDLIFPGLIDMHSHVKYNVLPIWDLAKGQFNNRFEWRERFAPYQAAVSGNMANIKGDTVCSAVRWAEVKAMTGGVTAIQGIGNDTKCAQDFGIHNLEIKGEFGPNHSDIRGMTDMIMPGLTGSVYLPMIAPYLKTHPGSTYDQAYADFLVQQRVSDFLQTFTTQPHTLSNGMKLLIGNDFGIGAVDATAFDAITPKLTATLTADPYSMNAAAASKQIATMKLWLFGAANNGYLTAPANQVQAMDYLSKGGVLSVTSPVRRYIGMFETSVRESAIKFYPGPLIAHLAEGTRTDAYNVQEWTFANDFGLVKEGLVVIHGVGMNATDFAQAAANHISIVWSPFSNLLLYGQTLDVQAAKAAGVNLGIGADWSPTGSKNLLDELKIAHRYLLANKISEISDEDLVQMATANAAKALDLSGVAGCVAIGCQADLMLIPKGSGDPYSQLVQATQQQVDLVVVAGQPIYGDPMKINQVADAWDGGVHPEMLPLAGASSHCSFQKAIRVAGMNSSYKTSVSDMQADLKAHMKFLPDPIFSCEDHSYSSDATMNYPLRFANFIETELPKNIAAHAGAHQAMFVKAPTWSPLDSGANADASMDGGSNDMAMSGDTQN